MQFSCAVLVLSAKYPSGVGALASYFALDGFDMFVHVDASIDEVPSRNAILQNLESVHFLENRMRIFWRGFTMVEATMRLLQAARAQKRYDRYMLISDDSVPLLPPTLLLQRLREATEFTDARPTGSFASRYDGFFMFDCGATSFRWVPVEDREITLEVVSKIIRLQAARLRGRKPIAPLFHGSQWWCLSSAAVQLILDSWTNDIWLRESFEFSEVPDEHYIQTILGQALDLTPRWFMYTDWSGPLKPHIYTEIDHIMELHKSGALFARKIGLSHGDLKIYIASLIGP